MDSRPSIAGCECMGFQTKQVKEAGTATDLCLWKFDNQPMLKWYAYRVSSTALIIINIFEER
jgi:hypothetical protein